MMRTAEDYPIETGDPLAREDGCLVLPVFAGRRLHGVGRALDEASDGQLSTLLERVGMRGRRGESRLLLDVPGCRCDRVLAIGCGERSGIDARRFRAIAENAATAFGQCGGGDVTSALALVAVRRRDRHWRVRQLIEALEHARYRFDDGRDDGDDNRLNHTGGTGHDDAAADGDDGRLNDKHGTGHDDDTGDDDTGEGHDGATSTDARGRVHRVTHFVADEASLVPARRARDEALACAAGTTLARDLGNRSPDVCTPTHLADAARALAVRHASIETEVLDEAAMEALGMGAVLAVSRGSAEPAAFAIARYRHPDAGDAAPEVLIGKGVTFDSGGLSLKQPVAMEHMKLDMAGAAAVLGALEAVARLALPLHVVVIVAAVENMPGSRATRPGDVVRTLSGRTVEILNTDAEGRLVLADAITWAKRLEPATVIDVATLTGSAKAALGRPLHALFSSSRSLTRELVGAGDAAHDRAWPMPLMEEYRHVLESKSADMTNVGGASAGASVAACFLWRFARGLRWAHLDVAGTASDPRHATGRPVGLLLHYLIGRAARRSDTASVS